MESFILFYEKCRLCLNLPGVNNMFETEELPRDIFLCTGVKVHPTDNLPQKICQICLKVVVSAKELRSLANKNNTHLRSLFDGYDSEPQLQIDEDNISFNEAASEDRNKSSTKKRENSSSNAATKNIAVRSDLFDSSTVTSSTKSQNEPTERSNKRIKKEDEAYFDYECSICDKTFKTHKQLYCHQRMHNKSVVCPLDVCSKKFATKGDLQKHFRTHTGEKPYECYVCKKSFSQRATLKAHRESLHANR